MPDSGKSSPSSITSPASSARIVPSSAGTLEVTGKVATGKAVAGKAVAGKALTGKALTGKALTGKAVAGLGAAIVGKTVFAAIVAGLSLVNLSDGALINRPSKFVIVLYTWKLSAL